MPGLVYRYSRRAVRLVHIKIGPHCPNSGSLVSLCCCGMCDCSAAGDWQETTEESALPEHLRLCTRCVDRIGGPSAYAELIATNP